MQVRVDDVPVDCPAAPGLTLHGLIEHVRRVHVPGRIIVGVEIDGRPLIDQELVNRLTEPVDAEMLVRFDSAAAGEVVAEAFGTIEHQLIRAAAEAHPLSGAFRRRCTPAEAEQLCAFLDVWHNCQQSLAESSSLLRQDLTAVPLPGGSVAERLGPLVLKLRELRDAFEARDATLVADLLGYEWGDLCRSWASVFRDLAAKVRTADAPADTTADAPAHAPACSA